LCGVSPQKGDFKGGIFGGCKIPQKRVNPKIWGLLTFPKRNQKGELAENLKKGKNKKEGFLEKIVL